MEKGPEGRRRIPNRRVNGIHATGRVERKPELTWRRPAACNGQLVERAASVYQAVDAACAELDAFRLAAPALQPDAV